MNLNRNHSPHRGLSQIASGTDSALTSVRRLLSRFIQPASQTDVLDREVESETETVEEAVVDQAIQPGKSGRVWYRGTWWPARCELNITLSPEEVVLVVGHRNITLLVEPLPQQA
jgi:membrane protein implicated in regulation of membrane protease activity